MNSSNTLNLKRLFWLIKNDLRLQSRPILIVACTVLIFLALMPFHVANSTAVYFLVLYTGGFIVTGLVFNELHDRSRASLALLLPCSNLERFLNKWFLTSFGYALGVLLIFYLFSLLSFVVNLFIFHQHIPMLNILQTVLWIGILKYVILQSILLLGAITFKKFALIKTALTLGCFLLVFGLFSIVLAWMFCPDCFQGMAFIQAILRGGHFIFWVIIAPFCWYITYLRLTEYELK